MVDVTRTEDFNILASEVAALALKIWELEDKMIEMPEEIKQKLVDVLTWFIAEIGGSEKT